MRAQLHGAGELTCVLIMPNAELVGLIFGAPKATQLVVHPFRATVNHGVFGARRYDRERASESRRTSSHRAETDREP
jgi:hypothetical protein